MAISSKGMYGLSAMYYLSKKDKNSPTQIKEIAKECDIPQNYLEQILVELKKQNLLRSVRGSQGGYLLIKEVEEITILEIIQALDGEFCINVENIKDPIMKLLLSDITSKSKQLFKIKLSELKKYEDLIEDNFNYSI